MNLVVHRVMSVLVSGENIELTMEITQGRKHPIFFSEKEKIKRKKEISTFITGYNGIARLRPE